MKQVMLREPPARSAKTQIRILLVVVFGVYVLHAAEAQTLKLRYGQAYSSAHSIFSLPVAVADQEGLFAREGLKVDIIVPIPGGSDKMIAALDDEWVDLTHVATPFLIHAALAGSDAVAIAAEFKNPIYSLIANSSINSFAELNGKTLGLADEAGSISISMRKLLAIHGVHAGDFGVKVIEGTPARWACLRRGECDAVVLGQPQDLQAIEQGYRLLGLSNEAVPDLLYTVTAVRRSWAETHKELVTRYVRALAAAFRFIRDPTNRERVIKVIVGTTGSSPAIAAQTLKLFFEPERGVLPEHGEIDLNGLEQVIAMMAEAHTLNPPLPSAERFVDLQYLRAAGVQ
jgi:ABC-type nitrate/sulfonate/bicarbonate transport system substrate-binding protein